MESLNVFGEKLITCSTNPMTGFYRNGCCQTGDEDSGTHTVCVLLTSEFLEFSKIMGNDLMTPIPAFDFPGLKEGDRWCLCALRWMEAYKAGVAPHVYLEATNEATLNFIPLSILIQFAQKS
ncbi:MAG: DUF2237 domain-containing protein [Algoriphagus sp.]|nr:DUF2237 domain-containing protein [Algoriphagus sp.]